jgi:hypothetical protein
MASTVAPSFSFIGLPEDTPAMVDVYNEVSPEVRSSLKSNITSFSSGLTGVYEKAISSTKSIKDMLQNNGMDLASAKRRLEGALKGSKADILSLGGMFEKTILQDLMGIESPTGVLSKANGAYNSVKMITENGEQIFKGDNYGKMQSIVGFMSDISGNPMLKMLDLGAEASILRGVMEEVSQWGVPELMDEVVRGQSPEVTRIIIQRAAPRIGYTSDVESIIRLMELAGTYVPPTTDPVAPGYYIPNPKPLVAETPNFATLMLANYTFVEGTTPGDYPTRLTRLVYALDLLKPDWFETYRGAEKVWNLGVIGQASEHAQLCFMTSALYRGPVITAPFYTTMRAQDLLKEMYPGIAIL